MRFKFSFFILIAALCLSGAAFLPSAVAQRRTRTRRPAPAAAVKPTPTPTPLNAPTPTPTPTPTKANARTTDDQAITTPSPVASATPASVKKSDAPRFYYEFNQPDFYLHHIEIEHDAQGRGQMTFQRKNDEEPLTEPLEISPAALARISAAWTALNFLDSSENYQTDRSMAHLGTMRLRMTAGTRARTAEFNWTHNQQAAALTNEYRRLADQQLFVFEIEVARQYQPSDSVKLLKGLEALINRAGVSDAAQLLPLLNDLSTDERIPLIARNQAAQLVKKIEKQSGKH
jgi:hypothetical protein